MSDIINEQSKNLAIRAPSWSWFTRKVYLIAKTVFCYLLHLLVIKLNLAKMLKPIKAFIVLSALSSISFVSALTISPARVELTGNPGSVISDKFIVINDQDSDQTFYTSVEQYEVNSQGTPTFFRSSKGLASWIKVQSQVTLKKGERITIPFSIEIPSNTQPSTKISKTNPKGNGAAIFLSTNLQDNSMGAKVGLLVLLDVNGTQVPVATNSITQPATSSVVISKNLKYGQRDDEVYELQDFLIDKGFLNGNSTGFFGLLTLKAVKAYQKSGGISPTGYVGLLTRQKINSEIMAEVESSIKAEQQEIMTSTTH